MAIFTPWSLANFHYGRPHLLEFTEVVLDRLVLTRPTKVPQSAPHSNLSGGDNPLQVLNAPSPDVRSVVY
jgi:hypothetical protein